MPVPRHNPTACMAAHMQNPFLFPKLMLDGLPCQEVQTCTPLLSQGA